MSNKELTIEEKEQVTVDDVEQLPDMEVAQLPLYVVAESKLDVLGVQVSIMDLQLKDLIFEKMYLLFQKLQPAMKELEQAKINLQQEKDKLLLETDFKTVLNESRPTVAMKEAYMQPKLVKFEKAVKSSEENIQFYKNKLNILNDLIKAERTLLNIEGALKH